MHISKFATKIIWPTTGLVAGQHVVRVYAVDNDPSGNDVELNGSPQVLVVAPPLVYDQFGGIAGDQPATGDFNGIGRDAIAIYRNTGEWFIKY